MGLVGCGDAAPRESVGLGDIGDRVASSWLARLRSCSSSPRVDNRERENIQLGSAGSGGYDISPSRQVATAGFARVVSMRTGHPLIRWRPGPTEPHSENPSPPNQSFLLPSQHPPATIPSTRMPPQTRSKLQIQTLYPMGTPAINGGDSYENSSSDFHGKEDEGWDPRYGTPIRPPQYVPQPVRPLWGVIAESVRSDATGCNIYHDAGHCRLLQSPTSWYML
ncbi:hypothetical protein FS749_011070 [Ceratobasidium sp. UAMH 11750]|nr:hypothetical protein FS749_011070 [Ceratobasidium sp. UAMH 11750]